MERFDKVWLFVGLTAVGALSVGFGGGYLFAQKKLTKEFEEELERQVTQAKAFYSVAKKQAEEKPESPLEALAEVTARDAEKFLIDAAGRAMTKYQSVAADTPFEVPENPLKNVFKAPVPTRAELGPETLEEGMPVRIDKDTFNQSEFEFDQVELTYYAGDDILADEKDEVVDQTVRSQWVGNHNLAAFADPDLTEIYVRNIRHKIDYEISRSEGKYSEEVAGFR